MRIRKFLGASMRGEEASVPMVLILTIVVGGLVTVLTASVLSAQGSVQRNRDFTVAYHGAEAGLQQALTRVSALSDPSVTSLDSGAVPEDERRLEDSEFTWTAERVNVNEWRIRATGSAQESTRTLEAVVERPGLFFLAAFAKVRLTMRGANGADSFNDFLNDTGKGAVGSNGVITMNGNAFADLIFLMGGGAECRGVGCGTGEITGSDDPFVLETDFITAALDPSSGDFECEATTSYRYSVDGPLAPGTYCFTDVAFDQTSTDMALPGVSSPDDAVVIYMTGDLTVARHGNANCPASICGSPGTQAPSTARPDGAALQIYSTGTSVRMGNFAKIAAAIYAPNASCEGNPSNAQAEVFGSLVCNDLGNQGGWAFHFDEDLLELGTGQFDITDLREEVGGSTSFD